MQKILCFFTANFPFGSGETFIENEIDFLSNSFDQIIIISNNTKDKQTRNLPNNVSIVRDDFFLLKRDKVLGLLNIFNPIVFTEIISSFFKKTPIIGTRLNYLLASYARAEKVVKKVNNLLLKFPSAKNKIYLYSYWCLDEAVGIALLKRKRPEIIAFSRAHGYDLYAYRQQNNYLPLRSFLINNLNKLYTISENGKTHLESNYKIKESNNSKIEIARLGTKAHENKLKHNTSPTLRIVSCSYIYPNKRINLIAESLIKIKEFDIEWSHLGDFTNWVSESYKQETLELFHTVKNSSNIEFQFKGYMSNPEIIDFYAQTPINIFINVSESEGIPVSIMEAMSFGIPAIATNVGGTNEIVNQKNGYLIDPESTSEEISNYIKSFYQLPLEEIDEKRGLAFETWNNNYNAEKNYANFVQNILKL